MQSRSAPGMALCRFCFAGPEAGELVRPCSCGPAHLDCLREDCAAKYLLASSRSQASYTVCSACNRDYAGETRFRLVEVFFLFSPGGVFFLLRLVEVGAFF